MVVLAPDVILVERRRNLTALQQATRTVPIVFVKISDPVGMGIVESLARPGGNATGLPLAEFGLSGKWLELLKEIAPGVPRVAVLRESSNPSVPRNWGRSWRWRRHRGGTDSGRRARRG